MTLPMSGDEGGTRTPHIKGLLVYRQNIAFAKRRGQSNSGMVHMREYKVGGMFNRCVAGRTRGSVHSRDITISPKDNIRVILS